MTPLETTRGPAGRRTVVVVGAVGALVLVLAALLVGLRGSGWQDWFRHRPAAFTELSFTDPTTLPTSYVPGREVDLEVTVVNRREEPTTLEYSVVLTSPAGTSTLDGSAASVRLDPGATQRLSVPVTLQAQGDVEVAVQLGDSTQHVDVLLTQDPA